MIKIENLTKVFRTTEVETIAHNKSRREIQKKEHDTIMGTPRESKPTSITL